MLGDIEVKDTPSIVCDDEKDKQYSEPHRRDREEVDGHEFAKVLSEKSLPGGRAGCERPRSVLLHRRFRDMDPKHAEFADNSRRAPRRIRLPHPPDETPEFGRDRRPTEASRPAQPSPMITKTVSLPHCHGPGLDKEQHTTPVGPECRDHRPQPAIRGRDGGTSPSHVVKRELVSQCSILELKRNPGTEASGDECQKKLDESGHGAHDAAAH